MELKCVPGEKILAIATLFAIDFSCGMEGEEILAWSDFFGAVTAGLITIADRRLYFEDPNSTCCNGKKQKQSDSGGTGTTGTAGASVVNGMKGKTWQAGDSLKTGTSETAGSAGRADVNAEKDVAYGSSGTTVTKEYQEKSGREGATCINGASVATGFDKVQGLRCKNGDGKK